MLRSGLLVLSTTNVLNSGNALSSIIESCVKTVCNYLYVHLVNYDVSPVSDGTHQCSKPVSFGSVLCTPSVRRFVSQFYTEAASIQQSLDVRFVLSNICSSLPQFLAPSPHRLQHGYEVVLTDLGQDLYQSLATYVTTQFPVNNAVKVIQLPGVADDCQTSSVDSR